ncbi:hypothetical protein NKH18_44045 [Streptomyces sp. M10(2022)]
MGISSNGPSTPPETGLHETGPGLPHEQAMSVGGDLRFRYVSGAV